MQEVELAVLEKPDLPDEKLISCLQENYGLRITQIVFLPLGADANTAVYRVVADDGTPYFLKLRRGVFDETTVAVHRFLSAHGIPQVIAPLETSARQLWTRMDDGDTFTVILYPFVAGRSGFEVELTERHLFELGAALKGIHTAVLPHALRQRIPHETYAPHWRDIVRTFQMRAEDTTFDDPIAAKLAAFLRAKRDIISDLVGRAEQFGNALVARPLEHVLCHADIHAANILIGANDTLYIVDWDTLILAPKERDLMFVGGGVDNIWRSAREETLFYEGYGQTELDPMALAYYRYERIVEDIAAFCEQLLLTGEGGADREQALRYLTNSFLPNRVVDIAYASDNLPRAG